MGTTNKGSQLVTWDFKHPAKGYTFNQLMRNAVKPGIYTGMTLTNPSGNDVLMTTGDMIINGLDVNRSKDNLAVKVTTQATILETINQTTPGENEVYYWVYEYIDQIQDWADPFHTSKSLFFASRPLNAVIIGEVTYDGGGNVTGFDYSMRDRGLIDDYEDLIVDPFVKAYPTVNNDTVIDGKTFAMGGFAVADSSVSVAVEPTGSIQVIEEDPTIAHDSDITALQTYVDNQDIITSNALQVQITSNAAGIATNDGRLDLLELTGFDDTNTTSDLAITGLPNSGPWKVTVQGKVYNSNVGGSDSSNISILEGGSGGTLKENLIYGTGTAPSPNMFIIGTATAIISGTSFYIDLSTSGSGIIPERRLVTWEYFPNNV